MLYRNILLIDDDEDDQEIFLEALAQAGVAAHCRALTSGIEALTALHGGLKPDIVFLDLNMPIMNGHQFLGEFNKLHGAATIPVYVLSTSSHHTAIEQAIKHGATGFFTKPDKFEELTDILRSILTGSQK